MDNRMSTAVAMQIPNRSQTRLIELFILLAVTLATWIVLLAPGTDSYGLDYAYLLETGDASRFLLSDHFLWHGSCWLVWQAGSWLDPGIRGLMAQQVCNLILFTMTMLALWFYLRSHGKRFWVAGLGLLASFASLKALVGGDVTAAPLLMMTLLLFILPGSGKTGRLLLAFIILTVAPLFHKSLFMMSAGWWLAEVLLSNGSWLKRVIQTTLIALASVITALLLYLGGWYLLISSKLDFMSWFFVHGSGTQGFFTLNIPTILKGLGLAVYRTFLSITPIKAFAQGSLWGLAGIVLSSLAFFTLLYLVIRGVWLGRKETQSIAPNRKTSNAILIALLPSLIFFLFWIPGYYTYWTRFLPLFWVLIILRLPYRRFWKWLEGISIGLMLVVNFPAQMVGKDGEEAGRFSRWLLPKLGAGDLVILPGNGVFFFGVMPKYYNHVETLTLDVLQNKDDPEGYLQLQAANIQQENHKVWLLMDYANWTSERLIQGEQAQFTRGLNAVERVFSVGPKEKFLDPAMKEAWLAQCLPR